MLQHDIDVQGEFASEDKMRDEWNWSELLGKRLITCFEVFQRIFHGEI